jgi:hypothetical protein
MTQETDENGNVINARKIPETTTQPIKIDEGIVAYGVQSNQPVEVIILETTEGLTEAGLKENQENNSRRPAVNITSLFNH